MSRPARPWFRFYVEAVHDRKLRRQKPEHRWLFVACLAAARQSPVAGYLLISERDPMTLADLEDFAAMPARAVADGMKALLVSGVLDWDLDLGAYFVPAWNERQYESDDVTARVRRHRERSKESDSNVSTVLSGTPPESESETDTEVCRLQPLSEPPDPWPDDDEISAGTPNDEKVAAVFARCAEAKMRGIAPTNATAYRARVIANLELESGAELRRLIGLYPAAPVQSLAGEILGEPNSLHTFRKATA